MERFSFVFFTAGLGFFILAFIVSGWVPMMTVHDMEYKTVEQLAQDVPIDFQELREDYPEAFEKAFGNVSDEKAFEAALRRGHKIYVGEACWHCHSQQVRPWGNDEARFGRVAYPEEYHNELHMPPLWGTRRVGPDLSREAGKQSNDWHVAHFYNPTDVVPWSVMPNYPWFFEDDGVTPNRDGLSIIAYVQSLGAGIETLPNDIYHLDRINAKYELPAAIKEMQAEHAAAQAEAASEEAAGDAYGGGDDAYGEGDSGGDSGGDDEYGY